MTGYITIALFLAAIGLVLGLIIRGLRIVHQQENLVVERLGKYHRTSGPGIKVVIPFLEQTRKIYMVEQISLQDGTTVERLKLSDCISLKQTILDFQKQDVITKDNLQIGIDALMMYQIIDPQRAVYVAENLIQSLKAITQTTLRSIIGEMALEETFSSREKINQKVRAALDHATDTWGVHINRVEIQNITPPEDIRAALEKQMRAERDKRALILEAEGKQKATVLEAQGDRDAQVSRAEAEKRAKILIAEGEAVARIRIAQAEAEAIKKISEAVNDIKGDPENYLLLTRYLETLREMTSGKDNKVVYMPYEATGVLSALGSIKELFTGNATTKKEGR
jgi:regulator of protease activity HflC (stomatin/prohibitin superfamily)